MLRSARIEPEWLVKFLTQACEASWTASADGYVWDIPEWRRLTGQSRAEVEGDGWLDAVHPDDREATRNAWKASVETGGLFNCLYRVRYQDGSYHLINSRGAPMRRSNGEIDQWFGVCLEIPPTPRSSALSETARIDQLDASKNWAIWA